MHVKRVTAAAGFSLIEMAVTLSIFAILAAVAVPTLRLWVANNRVRATTDTLENGLRLAKTEALRSSRQVVFALTNSTTPGFPPVSAVVNGTSWAVYTIPSMTDGTELPQFIGAGTLSNASANVTVNSNGIAALCFNSVGRLISNGSAGVTAVTGGAVCNAPTGSPAVRTFNISVANSDRPLQVNVALGGQLHMCDPTYTLSAANPEGC